MADDSNDDVATRLLGLRKMRLIVLAILVLLVVETTVLVVSWTSPGGERVNDGSSQKTQSGGTGPKDLLAKGIKVVDKGFDVRSGGSGHRTVSLGVVLENTTDRPLAVLVSFAFWREEAPSPWWTGPDDVGGPQFMTVRAGKEAGTGDTFRLAKSDSQAFDRLQVRAEVVDNAGGDRDVGMAAVTEEEPGRSMTAEITDMDRGQVGQYTVLTFSVDSTYSTSVFAAGFGLVFRDPDDGDIIGGWSKRPLRDIDDEALPDGLSEVYPTGSSRHDIAVFNIWTEVEQTDIEIFVWP